MHPKGRPLDRIDRRSAGWSTGRAGCSAGSTGARQVDRQTGGPKLRFAWLICKIIFFSNFHRFLCFSLMFWYFYVFPKISIDFHVFQCFSFILMFFIYFHWFLCVSYDFYCFCYCFCKLNGFSLFMHDFTFSLYLY